MCETVTTAAVALLGLTAYPAPAQDRVRVEELPGGYRVVIPRAEAARLRTALNDYVDEAAVAAVLTAGIDLVGKAVRWEGAGRARLAVAAVRANATAFKRALGERVGAGGATLTVRASPLGRLGAGLAGAENPLVPLAARLRARVQAAPLPAELKAPVRAALLVLATPVESLLSPSGWSLAPRN